MKKLENKESIIKPTKSPLQRKKQEQNPPFKDNRPESEQQLQRQAIADGASSLKTQEAMNDIAQLMAKPVVQAKKKNGKMRQGMASGKNKKGSKAAKQSNADRSYNNMKDYRPGWVRRNNITASMVAEFIKKSHVKKIRGHASGDNSKKEQDNTTNDLNAYKSWHTRRYGRWL